MNNKIVSLLGILLLGAATATQAKPGDSATQKAVAALEDKWTQAEKASDPDLLAPLLASRFINIGLDGKQSDRAKTLAETKTTKYASIDVREFHVTVFGNTAVASMLFKATATDGQGKTLNVNARWADTWVKMPDGAWQCVLSQGSSLNP
jgi:ketosteroid isomerase-like protein